MRPELAGNWPEIPEFDKELVGIFRDLPVVFRNIPRKLAWHLLKITGNRLGIYQISLVSYRKIRRNLQEFTENIPGPNLILLGFSRHLLEFTETLPQIYRKSTGISTVITEDSAKMNWKSVGNQLRSTGNLTAVYCESAGIYRKSTGF